MVEVLLIGGPAAGEVREVDGGKAVMVTELDDEGVVVQHYYPIQVMRFQIGDEVLGVYFGLYGDMTILDAINDLWGCYAEAAR